MFLTILVNLYAVRVIWQVLGVDDYGIYNVVGGIVMMFSFLNNAMVASSQRFISFELGTGDNERLKKVFSISVTVHVMLAIGILILAETIGLWFLNTKLNIPSDRMVAANWVYQCSIIAFMINVISVPYNACIVAHEHMKIYGYFSILEVIMKLVIVFLLLFIPFDKLITYSILVVCVSAIMRIIYGIYCRNNFSECNYSFISDHHLMRDMFSFAGWSFIGNLGFSVRDQGLNIVVNIFFNVAINAAKGVASQIGTVINGFSQNFQMALSPQITKRFAAGDTSSMMTLVFAGCKYSALLMMFIVLPLFFASEPVLKLWLGVVAQYTVGFMQLVLIMSLIDSMVSPITTALQATGRIKWFQIIISIIMLANIPLAWCWLKLEANPYIVLYVSILTSAIALVARLVLLHRQVTFSYREFLFKVICRIIPVFLLSGASAWWLYSLFSHSITGLVSYAVISVTIIAAVIFILGLEQSERRVLVATIINRIGKKQ
ncbi:MAG: lipopolysaccharide biosynthesis protein [Duncaniella sp.]|nr:lipopolysaccharide biosynthesis protein [Duncaniella sp.]